MSELEEAPVRFDTKIVIVVRTDLAMWQKLNMTAYLASGIAATEPDSMGEPYEDADSTKYLPMFRQPTMVFAATADELTRTMARALSRGVVPTVFTDELFSTGHDAANRAAVAAVAHDKLSLAGMAFRCNRKDADKITKGLGLHR